MISIQNQLVGALEGTKVTLECLSEAYPRSINYWTKENGEIVPQGSQSTYPPPPFLTFEFAKEAEWDA